METAHLQMYNHVVPETSLRDTSSLFAEKSIGQLEGKAVANDDKESSSS